MPSPFCSSDLENATKWGYDRTDDVNGACHCRQNSVYGFVMALLCKNISRRAFAIVYYIKWSMEYFEKPFDIKEHPDEICLNCSRVPSVHHHRYQIKIFTEVRTYQLLIIWFSFSTHHSSGPQHQLNSRCNQRYQLHWHLQRFSNKSLCHELKKSIFCHIWKYAYLCFLWDVIANS